MNASQGSSYLQGTDSKVRVIAGYALQQKLGAGSFAVVYKGVGLPQTRSEHATVAIKAITRNSEKLTKKVLQNLEVEIQILRTYRHRNIVCLHDVQKTERHFYLILEYCGGGDLQKLIRTRRSGRLTEGLTRRLMRDLASGLKFLWAQQLIHRDIKPGNLLLTGALPVDEENDPEKTEELELKRRQTNFPSALFCLKIADFGFARHLQTASLAETLCGSPLYMAPEILQHHRYDAKADLWSVGTVLFEMISGRLPFHGENHIDLLHNIQRKAVRLPQDVRVSKECVNLLRLLLNRSPLNRAGFKEFFVACDAFVALGCRGVANNDEGSCNRPTMDLGVVPEDDSPGTESIVTVATTAQHGQTLTRAVQPVAAPPLNASHGTQPPPLQGVGTALAKYAKNQPVLAPLVPSPPTSSPSPLLVTSTAGVPIPPELDSRGNLGLNTQALKPLAELNQSTRRTDGTVSQNSSDENSFVMVEHSSYQKSPTESTTAVVSAASEPHRWAPDARSPRDQTPPSSPPFFLNKSPLLTTRGDYMVLNKPKGMLSTSPGTGGALMGLLTGRARLACDSSVDSAKQLDSRIASLAKILATAEDVGRRAVSVAHVGDNRVYTAMRLLANESASSSVFSATPMEGIVEETVEQECGNVTDDSTSTEITSSVRRRRSSSATDKSMSDAKAILEAEEMPFAMPTESPPMATTPPLVAVGVPTRASVTFSKSTSMTNSRPTSKSTPETIRAHFGGALSCYLKALNMLKGSVGGAQSVSKEFLDVAADQRLSTSKRAEVEMMQTRCGRTSDWLKKQFKGVLERADAANAEVNKHSFGHGQHSSDNHEVLPIPTVEELIYNHSLAAGREGAVKQLLGQYEAARFCYRTAGLLAETLLMEPDVGSNDKRILEDYVDGFAARITELDEMILQEGRPGRLAGSSVVSARRGSAVVGLIGQPFAGLIPQSK